MKWDNSLLKPHSLTHPFICNPHSLSLPTQEQARTLETRERRDWRKVGEEKGEEEGKHQQQLMDTLHPSTHSW
jgi:hypothetical protein